MAVTVDSDFDMAWAIFPEVLLAGAFELLDISLRRQAFDLSVHHFRP